MTWIKTPRDDQAIRNIQRINASANTIGRARSAQDIDKKDLFRRETVPIKRQSGQNRRKKDRRKDDRRQQQTSVLLNTRASHDRRKSQRRDDQEEMKCIKIGIDQYC